jgi:hypothetical protein
MFSRSDGAETVKQLLRLDGDMALRAQTRNVFVHYKKKFFLDNNAITLIGCVMLAIFVGEVKKRKKYRP